MAGPIDYVEHRSPSKHRQDNWRHRLFGLALDIELLCPTCLNVNSSGFQQVMDTNRRALESADFLVAYFPADVATFGTPIEVWEWCHRKNPAVLGGHPGVIVHPESPGVFVEYLHEVYALEVVHSFEEARSWLRRQLTAPSST
jgi:hypothetical protein